MAIEPAVAASLKILAIETSTELCSVALLVGEDLHCDAALAPNQHAERLMPMIRQLLGSADLPMSGVDAVAFGQGPGSFTGLRIACGIAQGLALGASRPVIAVPSVLALAEQAGGARVVVGLDARMGETYLAAYTHTGSDWSAVVEPALFPRAALPSLEGSDWVAVGSGFDAFDWLREAYAPRVGRHVGNALPRADAVARLAARRLARGEVLEAEGAAPLYLRDKVALTTQERRAGG